MIARYPFTHAIDQWSSQASTEPGLPPFHEKDTRRPIFRFGPFTVTPRARAILRQGRRINLGSRAFDLLVVLLNSHGSVVSKADILSYVWPSTVVEESNLRFQVTCLRKALGNYGGAIITIPGRGYFFAAETVVEWNLKPEGIRPRAA